MALEVITARRAEPKDDLISVLVQAEIKNPDGTRDALTDDEIVNMVRLLVPAGAQTTYRTLTNLLVASPHPSRPVPDARRAIRRSIPRAIEEGLRWEAPLLSFGRTAARDTEIAGHPIASGTTVNLCVHSANRDPSRWADPDRFDITRPPKGNLSFGQGNHICLGIHFARMELRVALELIIEHLPNLRLDPDADDVHIGGLASRGVPSSVPVRAGTSDDCRSAHQGCPHHRRHRDAVVPRRCRGARRADHPSRSAARTTRRSR